MLYCIAILLNNCLFSEHTSDFLASCWKWKRITTMFIYCQGRRTGILSRKTKQNRKTHPHHNICKSLHQLPGFHISAPGTSNSNLNFQRGRDGREDEGVNIPSVTCVYSGIKTVTVGQKRIFFFFFPPPLTAAMRSWARTDAAGAAKGILHAVSPPQLLTYGPLPLGYRRLAPGPGGRAGEARPAGLLGDRGGRGEKGG